ncbi:MAG: M24 family metallopeptidase, partial [Acidimicrobiales bacterium]
MKLPPVSAQPRISEIVESLAAAGLDAILVTHAPNVRYLSGFSGSSAMLLVTPTATMLSTDGRYAQRAQAEVEAVGVDLDDLVIGNPQTQLAQLACSLAGGARIGLEADHIAWGRASSLVEGALSEFDVVPTSSLIETVRLRKDPAEIARMRRAAEIASASLTRTIEAGLIGRSERELVIEIEQSMVELGAGGASFPTIVATGFNAANPHALPGNSVVAEGDLVVFDLGAEVDGYCSDMTRTLPVGALTSDRELALQVVTQAQQRGVDALGPGVDTADVDAACRDYLTAEGFGEFFVHGTGHGVGLDIHEQPFLGSTTTGVLEEGMVVTVEPGVYLPGRHGAR